MQDVPGMNFVEGITSLIRHGKRKWIFKFDSDHIENIRNLLAQKIIGGND